MFGGKRVGAGPLKSVSIPPPPISPPSTVYTEALDPLDPKQQCLCSSSLTLFQHAIPTNFKHIYCVFDVQARSAGTHWVEAICCPPLVAWTGQNLAVSNPSFPLVRQANIKSRPPSDSWQCEYCGAIIRIQIAYV
jgi:hypothetical protein